MNVASTWFLIPAPAKHSSLPNYNTSFSHQQALSFIHSFSEEYHSVMYQLLTRPSDPSMVVIDVPHLIHFFSRPNVITQGSVGTFSSIPPNSNPRPATSLAPASSR